ncbi:MAG: hypothetical protein FWG87_08950 [Defluviitaleaceae bacterium]|nr:hypothetical protein [Defluviitaleaceae bacterium]
MPLPRYARNRGTGRVGVRCCRGRFIRPEITSHCFTGRYPSPTKNPANFASWYLSPKNQIAVSFCLFFLPLYITVQLL